MNLNFDSICRLCLECGRLKSIFKTTRSFDKTTAKLSCSEMVVTFASVAAEENDGLPAHICTKCISKLKAAYLFKKQCENSYQILLSGFKIASAKLVKEEKVESFQSEIKLEDVKIEQLDLDENRLENFDDDSMIIENYTVYDDRGDGYNDSDADLPIILLKNKCKKRRLKKLKNNGIVRKKFKKPRNTDETEQVESSKKIDKSKEILGIDVNSLRAEDGKFQCNQCPRHFSCRRSFIRHLERHLGIKSFFCDICQKYFAREWAHMQTHKRPRIKRFQCDQCDKMFENRGALNVHAFTHSDDKPYICNECGKAFKRLERLEIHKKVHSNVKEYICQFCSREFRMQKNLITHIMYKHTKERKYQCTRCEKRFVTGQCLKIHERRHLGIKNYHCEYCDKSFVSSSGMLTHLKMHTKEKPHPCRVCSVRFGRTDHRNRHEMTAHGKSFKSQNIA
ncbi:uncharacterized protein LOC143917884 [Arctopsyche grandis]|uniref:uncharacterized protein LOC143917884 n=1 Tax=Arctopsyche grandis TaxID=121162 RepID=UPI00406D6DD5